VLALLFRHGSARPDHLIQIRAAPDSPDEPAIVADRDDFNGNRTFRDQIA
jgi:hypothetical protein